MKHVVLAACLCGLAATAAEADPLHCSMPSYRAQPGLTATAMDNLLSVTWTAEGGQELRLRFALEGGTPTIRELAVRRNSAAWTTLASNLKPEYRLVAGLRRITNQQLVPLRGLKVELTPEIVEKYKWDAFWDAPLDMAPPSGRGGNPPPAQGVANQPGLPRSPTEVRRASAVFHATGCEVKTDGAHLEVSFPGVDLGMFSGRLQYTVYKGASLIRQDIVARTSEPSVAYKFDAGLSGLPIAAGSRMVWRDLSNLWQDYAFGGATNTAPVPLRTSNRTLVAELAGGSIAAFPPPHSFFWAREISINLGYSWYRKDSATTFAFGIRQPEQEHHSENPANFALYSARPDTWQRMPMFLYVGPAAGQATLQSALAYTRQDRYKPLAGHQVMATHFHTSMPGRLQALGSIDEKLPDLEAMKAAGINVFAPVDGGRLQGDRLEGLAYYYDAARRHSDKNFLVMPNEESNAGDLGGHNDVLLSKPVFWTYGRKPGEPFAEQHPKYGTVYRVGGPADMMELASRENMLVYMPHPRSKGSTGFPDAIKDSPQFNHDHYRGIGVRWGMGLDGSETTLCQIRCQTLLDDMNNWVADRPGLPKFLLAITETYENAPGDDIYGSNPVNYVKLPALPPPENWTPLVDALKRGDYFWTSGEVLIPSYEVKGAGARRTITADVEWTFPLAFVEVVWGDGMKTDRQVIATTDAPPFGSRRFEVPFDAAGKKWVRFAAWDVAGNGAMVQPIKLTSAR
jgi:hypothetical protein